MPLKAVHSIGAVFVSLSLHVLQSGIELSLVVIYFPPTSAKLCAGWLVSAVGVKKRVVVSGYGDLRREDLPS